MAFLLPGIDLEDSRRHVAARQMVIGDHHVETDRQRGMGRGRRGGAAIDGDHQRAASLERPLDVHRLKAVAVLLAVRDDRFGGHPAGLQHRLEERRAADAVDVVVADQRHLFVFAPGRQQTLHGGFHAVERVRRMHLIEAGMQKVLGFFGGDDSAAGQQRGQPVRKPCRVQGLLGGKLGCRHPNHFLDQDAAFRSKLPKARNFR